MPPRTHDVAILALPSVVLFDLAVPLQVFGYPRPDLGAMRYRAFLCGPAPGPVMTASGFPIVVPHGLGPLRRAQTIIVVGVEETGWPVAPAVRRALQRAHARGARIVSIFTGAFVLAAAGLLRGRRATTHWLDVADFRQRFPDVPIDPDVLYVDEGQVLTSAGLAAGIDLCLHVVRRDHGPAVANAVARRLVVPAHREGGQAQFIPRPDADVHGALRGLLDWMRAHLHEPLPVARLAERASLSVRHFIRRFRDETGRPPLQWILAERIRLAQRFLEETDLGVEVVASRAGFGSAMSLRGHFQRHVRISPSAYRRSFRKAQD